jgi:predicted NAD/FAD-binding protein
MNILQSLRSKHTFCVTLNRSDEIAPQHIIKRLSYDHPIYTPQAIAAQARQADINIQRTFFCGAYWRNGFHEDGVWSAIQALAHFDKALKNI